MCLCLLCRSIRRRSDRTEHRLPLAHDHHWHYRHPVCSSLFLPAKSSCQWGKDGQTPPYVILQFNIHYIHSSLLTFKHKYESSVIADMHIIHFHISICNPFYINCTLNVTYFQVKQNIQWEKNIFYPKVTDWMMAVTKQNGAGANSYLLIVFKWLIWSKRWIRNNGKLF